MTVETDLNYIEGLKALRDRRYEEALDSLKLAEKEFAENRDLRILIETIELLIAVKNDIGVQTTRENRRS